MCVSAIRGPYADNFADAFDRLLICTSDFVKQVKRKAQLFHNSSVQSVKQVVDAQTEPTISSLQVIPRFVYGVANGSILSISHRY